MTVSTMDDEGQRDCTLLALPHSPAGYGREGLVSMIVTVALPLRTFQNNLQACCKF